MNNKLRNEINELKCLVEQQRSKIQMLENAIMGLPNNVYWKNNMGVYLAYNPISAMHIIKQIEYSGSIIGLNDHDIFSCQTAEQYRENDLKVINSGNPMVVEEILVLSNGTRIPQLSMKSPLYNENKKIIGICGQTIEISLLRCKKAQNFFSFPITETCIDRLKFFITFFFLLSNTGTSRKKNSYQPLTLREKECAYYLLKGSTIKVIGRNLNISSRTVETHLENMKNKLNCYSKTQLVDKLFTLCAENNIK